MAFIGKPRYDGSALIYNIGLNYNQPELKVTTKRLDFYGSAPIFTNEFLDIVNRTFGTTYPFNEEYHKEKGLRHGNIDYHWDFALHPSGGGWELLHHYYYDGDSTSFIGLGGISTAACGIFTKEELLMFAQAVDEFRRGTACRTTLLPIPPVDSQRIREIEDECARVNAEIDAEIEKTCAVLKATVKDKDTLEKACRAVNDGFFHDRQAATHKRREVLANLKKDRDWAVMNTLKLPALPSGFTRENVDDCCNCQVYIRCYCRDSGCNIGVSITDGGFVTFSFRGDIVGRNGMNAAEFDVNDITYEELIEMMNMYFTCYRKAMQS